MSRTRNIGQESRPYGWVYTERAHIKWFNSILFRKLGCKNIKKRKKIADIRIFVSLKANYYGIK